MNGLSHYSKDITLPHFLCGSRRNSSSLSGTPTVFHLLELSLMSWNRSINSSIALWPFWVADPPSSQLEHLPLWDLTAPSPFKLLASTEGMVLPLNTGIEWGHSGGLHQGSVAVAPSFFLFLSFWFWFYCLFLAFMICVYSFYWLKAVQNLALSGNRANGLRKIKIGPRGFVFNYFPPCCKEMGELPAAWCFKYSPLDSWRGCWWLKEGW